MIDEICVQEGDLVASDQVLIQLSPVSDEQTEA